jgi:hypothetical protein
LIGTCWEDLTGKNVNYLHYLPSILDCIKAQFRSTYSTGSNSPIHILSNQALKWLGVPLIDDDPTVQGNIVRASAVTFDESNVPALNLNDLRMTLPFILTILLLIH